jgi:WD40 repeat protein/tRNA A-37 threonylcarbamoyl transferase component Bud32/energy-coupling factor transporter ATP-binding protein EcfA2
MRVLEADPRIGSELAGYRLEALLGRGGMGVVYLAQDPWLERQVALKLVAPERSRDEHFRTRFLRESRLAASLEHADVVPIYEAGEAGGHLYLAMRYVGGSDLKRLLEEEGRLDPARALAILERVAVALDAAHAKGLVHRDVKPGNILLEGETDGDVPRRVYLSDFGLTSRAADEDPGEVGELAGTLDYLAPEQVEGRPVSAATDVYSLGCVLYQCLTGEAPYPRDSRMEVLWAHLEGEPPRPSERSPGLPEALDAVVARALAKEPQSRYASCRELVAAARHALGDGAPARAMPAAARNPYKGLRPFGEADADDYFGREALTDALLERLSGLDGGRFVAVVGPSGSGKSSLLKAGLIPRLRQGALPGSERWPIAELVPGPSPFQELAAALRTAAPQIEAELGGLPEAARAPLPENEVSELVLVIDQFEELFTMADEDERGRFLATLEDAVADPHARVRLVIALRADFYDRPLRYPAFGALVEAGQVNVHPLSPEELEQAITGPAHAVGVALEPGLVADIVADVAEHPGALPLLQYALTELFERRESATLTAVAYRQIGGVSGALARRAEELYGELDDGGKEAARKLFSRLVTLGEGTEDTRRRVRREEVTAIEGSADAIEEVIDGYGRQRLLSFDRDPVTHSPTVEIAHEALLREWPRLMAWIDEDRDGLRLLRHLTEAAVAWRKLDRDPGELYRGARLEAALAWAEAHPDDLNPLEREFLDRGRALREEEERGELERIEQRIRQNRRLRIALTVVAMALVGAVVAGILALRARNSEADARFAAENGRLVAESANVLPKNRRLALLLAAEAYRRDPSVASLGALQRALTGMPGFLGYLGVGRAFLSAAFTPDGKQLIAVSRTGIEVHDLANGLRRGSIELPRPPSASALSANGDLAAVATGRIVRVYDVPAGTERQQSFEHSARVRALMFSRDLDRLAAGGDDGSVVLWDLSSGAAVREIGAHAGPIRELAFSRDGSLLATTPSDDPNATGTGRTADPLVVRLWDSRTGAKVGDDLALPSTPTAERWGASAIGFGPGGTIFAAGQRALRRWNLSTRRPLGDVRHPGLSERIEPTQERALVHVVLLPDSKAAFATGAKVTVVDLETGRAVGSPLDSQLTVESQRADAQNLAISHDGSTLAVLGLDGIALWSLDGRQLIARAVPRGNAAFAVTNADNSRLIANATFGSPPIVWNIAADPPVRMPFSERPGYGLFVEDGRVLFTRPILGDTRGVQPYEFRDPVTLAPTGVSLDPKEFGSGEDANREAGLFAMGQLTVVKTFDLDTGRVLAKLDDLVRFRRWIWTVDFSPDGKRFVATTEGGRAIVWDTSTWKPIRSPLSAEGVARFAYYSPDGR